jgi:hypothetical protein
MNSKRETWLAIGLLTLLVLVTVVAGISQAQQAEKELPALSSYSSAPNGTRALRLWLEEIGYVVKDRVSQAFLPPQDADVMLILAPSAPIEPQEWEAIDDWIERGGTMVLVGEGSFSFFAAAVQHYEFSANRLDTTSEQVTAQTPLLASPPLANMEHVQPSTSLRTDRTDYITLVAAGPHPVTVSFQKGQGRVIICSMSYPFTNAGLKEEGNPELALNVVTANGQAAGRPIIWLDEWHHGVRPTSTTVTGPGGWLRYTPSGHALLYTALVIFVALLLTGRRFGRAVPMPQNIVRRGPLEYVTAIANLSRRAGHRQAVLRYHYQTLKRTLGKRYRLNPTLPDEEYVARLAEFNPDIDAQALRSLLAKLRRKKVSENDVIQLAAQVAACLKE